MNQSVVHLQQYGHISANARALASYQADAYESHSHATTLALWNTSTGTTNMPTNGTGASGYGIVTTAASGGSETRGPNTALAPMVFL